VHDRTRRALTALGAWAADVAALTLALILATPVAGMILFLVGWVVFG